MSKRTIGIIGFGDFSKLLVRYLHPYFDIVVTTRQKDLPRNLSCKFVTTQVALAQPMVIPSMPAQYLEDYFRRNAKYLSPGSLVIDVCSAKVKSVCTLKSILPKNVNILATHPLFGPASAAQNLAGQRIMLYPARLPEAQYQKIRLFLQNKLKLKVIECSPEAHDKALAYVQGLSHYIGRVMQSMDIPETELMTDAYADLLDMKRIQGGDSWELFESIMLENPYALHIQQVRVSICQSTPVSRYIHILHHRPM